MASKLWEMVVFHPDPFALRMFQVFNLISTINLAIAELQGHGMRYSKFAPSTSSTAGGGRTFPAKRAMAIVYAPAAAICSSFLLLKFSWSPASSSANLSASRHPAVTMLCFFAQANSRLIIFAVALTLHFVKRIVEVFVVHKYSGTMERSVSFTIAMAYTVSSLNLLYSQQLSVLQEPPAINLMGWGLRLFGLGILGNFYHHYLLARLRQQGKKHDDDDDDDDADGGHKKGYVIPQGGLFPWLVCPHYVSECVVFLGLAMVGQTTSAFVNAVCVFMMLSSRSLSTKRWYLNNIPGFPRQRKALIPFLF